MSNIVMTFDVASFNMDELENRILTVMASEIETEVKKRTPVGRKYGGYMRDHWNIAWPIKDHRITIFNNTFYLPWHIRGTGIYGPHGTPICATGWRLRGTYAGVGKPMWLRWIDPDTNMPVFRRCVRGIKPNPFVQEGIEAGAETAMNIIRDQINSGEV